WPSPEELVALGKQVVAFSSEPAGGLLSYSDVPLSVNSTAEAQEIIVRPKNLEDACNTVPNVPLPSFVKLQGDLTEYRVGDFGRVIYEGRPPSHAVVTAGDIAAAQKCGFSPALDRIDAELMEAVVWSWDMGYPTDWTGDRRCATLGLRPGSATRRWTDVSCDDDEVLLRHGCVNDGDTSRTNWWVSA
ncbi:unnamed protein product, partial [Chrysoparadoxa australica]